MSTLDQPLLIANVNYHVGHWVAIYVAEEQGFFKQEGLSRYEYERSGLLLIRAADLMSEIYLRQLREEGLREVGCRRRDEDGPHEVASPAGCR